MPNRSIIDSGYGISYRDNAEKFLSNDHKVMATVIPDGENDSNYGEEFYDHVNAELNELEATDTLLRENLWSEIVPESGFDILAATKDEARDNYKAWVGRGDVRCPRGKEERKKAFAGPGTPLNPPTVYEEILTRGHKNFPEDYGGKKVPRIESWLDRSANLSYIKKEEDYVSDREPFVEDIGMVEIELSDLGIKPDREETLDNLENIHSALEDRYDEDPSIADIDIEEATMNIPYYQRERNVVDSMHKAAEVGKWGGAAGGAAAYFLGAGAHGHLDSAPIELAINTYFSSKSLKFGLAHAAMPINDLMERLNQSDSEN